MTDTIARSTVWEPVLKSAGIGTINRVVAILARLALTPLLINHLGMDRYGLWMTIASFSGYALIFDLGISSALVGKVTRLHAEADHAGAGSYISSALLYLAGIAACCAAASFVVAPAVDWGALFKLSGPGARHEAELSLLVLFLLLSLQLPLSVVLKVPYAMQAGWLSEAYQVGGTVATFGGTLVGVFLGASLPFLVLFLAGSALFAGTGILAHLLLTGTLRLTRPTFATLRRHWGELKATSLDFMLLQSAGLLMYSLQFTLLALYHGTGAVALYGLITQILIALQVPFTVIQQPMWTRMTQIVHRSDIPLLRSMFARYLKYACGYSVVSSCFILFLVNPVVRLVLRDPPLFPLDLLVAFAVACTLGIVAGGGVGTLMLALDLSRPLALITVMQLAVFMVGVVSFVPNHGAVGMISSVSATYAVAIPFSYWAIRRRLGAGPCQGGASA